MCGIAGAIYINSTQQQKAFEFSSSAIKDILYRGPDNNKIESLDNACMGSCRLSIHDVRPVANMPMKSDCLRYTLVFNGEIYNYDHLRKNFLSEFNFKTNSDTEVVLNAFIKYGTKCLDKFEGMFAIAIWDKKLKKLFLARDRLGKKPLHYYLEENIFYFCSESKPLKKVANENSSLNKKFLQEIVLFGEQSNSETVNNKIYKIVPNTFSIISLSKSKIKKENYKYSSIFQFQKNKNTSDADLYDALLEAVSLRLIADRPLGIALSGGIDSTVLCKIISDSGHKRPPAFTVRFDKKDEEVKRAKRIARRYKLEHYIIDYEYDERNFFEIIKTCGDPFCDPGLAYLSYICKKLPKDIKVLITGDGGDEAFLGYAKYNFCNFYSKFPNWIKDLSFLITNKTSNLDNAILRLILNRLHILQVYSSSNMKNLEKNTFSYLKPFISDKTLNNFNSIIEERNNRFKFRYEAKELYKEYSIRDITNRLSGRYLPKVDLAGAYNGVEIRSPFLDDKLLSLALNNTIKGDASLIGKPFLKKLLLNDFPKSFINKTKTGFSPANFLISKESAYENLISIKTKDLSKEINEIADAFLKHPILMKQWYSKSIIWNLMCINAWCS